MKRYPARPRKDYRWDCIRSEGTLGAGGTLRDVCANPSNVFIQGRATVNVQRLIYKATISVQAADLLSISTGLYTRVSWFMALNDIDDTTSFDPEVAQNLVDETVLAFGETEPFGYGTTQSLLAAGSGVVLAQTAVCMAYTRIHLDLRMNRKIDVDNEVVTVYLTRPAFNEIEDANELSFESTCRTLYKGP